MKIQRVFLLLGGAFALYSSVGNAEKRFRSFSPESSVALAENAHELQGSRALAELDSISSTGWLEGSAPKKSENLRPPTSFYFREELPMQPSKKPSKRPKQDHTTKEHRGGDKTNGAGEGKGKKKGLKDHAKNVACKILKGGKRVCTGVRDYFTGGNQDFENPTHEEHHDFSDYN